MNVLGLLRTTYFYAALSIAGGAIVIALVGLAGVALQRAGLSTEPPTPQSVRETVSGSVAALLFAVPIGAVHLWLVLRSLRDPSERAAGPRHLFLNAWVVIGSFVSLVAISQLATVAIVERTLDLAYPVASLLAGIVVAAIGWWWRDRYGPAPRWPQILAAFATLLIATVAIAVATIILLDAVLYTAFGPAGQYGPPPETIWSALVSLAASFVLWGLGLRWQWHWDDTRVRTYYAALGLFVGVALVAVPGTDALARAIGIVRGAFEPLSLRGMWEFAMVGVVLVAMHLPWLLRDRGRVGYPPFVTDRLVSGIVALGGLAALTLAATACGSVLVQDVLRIGPPQPDPLRVRDQAAAALVIGLALYPFAWWRFVGATRDDPRSGLRRLYLLFVNGAALLGVIVAGVVGAGNVIQMFMGADLGEDARRETIDAAGWVAIFAVLLAVHVWILLRDIRAARALAPAERGAAGDPIVPILEEVAAGRVPPREAAQRIRALRSPFHLPGLP